MQYKNSPQYSCLSVQLKKNKSFPSFMALDETRSGQLRKNLFESKGYTEPVYRLNVFTC